MDSYNSDEGEVDRDPKEIEKEYLMVVMIIRSLNSELY